MPGWIGVDLDGTLAKSVKRREGEKIGVPIHPMVQLVKAWLAHGEDVRIFTGRVNPNRGQVNATRARRAIEAWCESHLGQVLPITHEKDWDMTFLFDDKARQVERDTGRVLSCNSRQNPGGEDSDGCFYVIQPRGATNAKVKHTLSSDIGDANASRTQSRQDVRSRNRR